MTAECKVLNSRTVYKGRVFDVIDDEIVLPNGATVKRATVTHPGSVAIMPVLEGKWVLAIKQYRHPLRKTVLEFPAGTLEVGESPVECAKREICEETGYAAAVWHDLGFIYPAPGISNEMQYLFLAENLSPHKLQGDEDEVIEVEQMSIAELEIAIKSGVLSDGKAIALYMRARMAGLI